MTSLLDRVVEAAENQSAYVSGEGAAEEAAALLPPKPKRTRKTAVAAESLIAQNEEPPQPKPKRTRKTAVAADSVNAQNEETPQPKPKRTIKAKATTATVSLNEDAHPASPTLAKPQVERTLAKPQVERNSLNEAAAEAAAPPNDDFDRILQAGPRELEDGGQAKETLKEVKKSGAAALLKPRPADDLLTEEERESVEAMREVDPAAADELEADFLSCHSRAGKIPVGEAEDEDGGEDFDYMLDPEEGEDEGEDEAPAGLTPAERKELIVAIGVAASRAGQTLPRKWEKKSDEELQILADLLKAKRKGAVVQEMTRRAYFTCTSLVETLGPRLTWLGPDGLQVAGLTALLESDSLIDQALGLVAEELESSMKDYINPYTMLALGTASAISRCHASNMSMILAAKTAPPDLIERMQNIRRLAKPQVERPGPNKGAAPPGEEVRQGSRPEGREQPGQSAGAANIFGV